VFADGQAMLKRSSKAAGCTANGVVALLPGQHGGRRRHRALHRRDPQPGGLTWHGLRQQTEKPVVDGVRAPAAAWPTSSRRADAAAADYIGLFAVTAGLGVEKKEKQFLADHDDYSPSCSRPWPTAWPRPLPKRLHQRVRTDLWGYAPTRRWTTKS
jgi:5-methyltetrahydrofolate--homocysteine methyltransferase